MSNYVIIKAFIVEKDKKHVSIEGQNLIDYFKFNINGIQYIFF